MPSLPPFSRARVVAALAAVAAVAFGSALVALPAQAAPAPSESSCDFATTGTGTYADTLCWLDLSAYDGDLATAVDGQAFVFDLPGGYTLHATVASSADNVYATALPTFADAYLGQNRHYSGIAGKPALYQSEDGGSTTVTLSDIAAFDSAGNPVTGFSLVGADAESTDGTEHITWTSSSALTSLGSLGNACPSGFTGVGTTSVTCTGGATGVKTGTPIVAAAAPSTFTQEFTGRGLEGVAFGVLVSKIQLTTSFSGAHSGVSASVGVTTAGGASVGTAATGAAASATTGAVTLLSNAADSPYTLRLAAASGSLKGYTSTWSCTQNTVPATALPKGAAGTATSVALHAGDFVRCAIVLTARAAAAQPVAADPVASSTPVATPVATASAASGDELAYTGSDVDAGAIAAILLLVSGLGLIVWRRRRTP